MSKTLGRRSHRLKTGATLSLKTGATLLKVKHEEWVQRLKDRFERADRIRRGVCLLNAGQYEQAEATFKRVLDNGSTDPSVASYLAACLLGQGEPEAAAEQFSCIVAEDSSQVAAQIRHALALWSAQKCDEAIHSLREGIRSNPECAELHFQLGTLLASLERYEEAELRFTQALNIDRDHTEALVSYALCCAVRNTPSEALSYLRRAQALNPHDARIGLLLSQTAKAVQHQGLTVRMRAQMPKPDLLVDSRGIEELSRVIEAEPDFVDAFLSLPVGQFATHMRVDECIFTLLLKTLEAALERQPEHAELHFHCGRVLDRLGRHQDAINENERAVQIDPTFIRALIELAKLYRKTDRTADAATRLEQAIAAGAEYADVYYLLGNLYRDRGNLARARRAYAQAIVLNERYEAAEKALEALPA